MTNIVAVRRFAVEEGLVDRLPEVEDAISRLGSEGFVIRQILFGRDVTKRSDLDIDGVDDSTPDRTVGAKIEAAFADFQRAIADETFIVQDETGDTC